jgi:indolepyruvate ferredoxin oxidoreductase alpha subunit
MSIVDDSPGKRALLLGNEAIARGAVEAGVQLGAGYPGTPSSEVIESLAEASGEPGFYVEWSTNEAVAFNVAAGASVAGGRSIFTCKGAGLNVVMDMLMTLPYTGVRGGMVVFISDDPGAWYSSNEQDSRFAGMWAEIPILEPADQQEAKDMTREAFEISERLEIPIMVRSCTRLSHASGDVVLGEIRSERNSLAFDKHWKIPYRWNVYGPPGTIAKHSWQRSRKPLAVEYSESTAFNQLIQAEEGTRTGVITSGMASNYVREALTRLRRSRDVGLLILGMPYPAPPDKMTQFMSRCDKVLCVEEGGPLIERQALQVANDADLDVKVYGRLTGGHIPQVGELDPDKVVAAVAGFLGLEQPSGGEPPRAERETVAKLVCARSSSWCAGCPHMGSFWALKRALPAGKINVINTGIGCYEMSGYGIAANPVEATETSDSRLWRATTPYEMTDTLYVMGSETGLSQGLYQVGYRDGEIVSVLGDSSFFHTNLPPIANAVYNKAEQLIVVMDNLWTCMTGHQPNPSTGLTAMGEPAYTPSIEEVCRALGVKYVRQVDPYDLKSARKAMQEALRHEGGPAVVVARRVCALQRLRELRRERARPPVFEVNDRCTGCKQCLYLGCPAIGFDPEKRNAEGRAGVAFIDPLICVGCGLCAQDEVCSFDAHDKLGEGEF